MSKRILLTRSKADNAQMMSLLQDGRTIPLQCSCIETRRTTVMKADLPSKGEWLFFTSGKGVRFFMEAPGAAACMESCFIAVVGPSTGCVVEEYGFRVDFMPSVFEANVMMAEFVQLFPHVMVIWHVRSRQALEKLADGCLFYGLRYVPVVVYETIRFVLGNDDVELIREADWLSATSPSIVHVLEQAVVTMVDWRDILEKPIFCIGPTTAQAALDAGFSNVYYPDVYTVQGLVALMELCLEKEGSKEDGNVSGAS